MNQRLQELADQAYAFAVAEYDEWKSKNLENYEGIPNIRQTYSEKFAELIVQECLDQCYNRGMNDELYEGQLKAAAYIEQHFRIE
jgi:hypothetical protein